MSNEPTPEAWDEPDDHTDQFLVLGAPTGRFPKGYTDEPVLASRDEPQALTKRQWKDHVNERSKRDEEQRRKFEAAAIEQARRLMSFEERLVSAHDEARRRCVDVSSEVRLVRHMRDQGKAVRHLETRLFVIERKVWSELEDAA